MMAGPVSGAGTIYYHADAELGVVLRVVILYPPLIPQSITSSFVAVNVFRFANRAFHTNAHDCQADMVATALAKKLFHFFFLVNFLGSRSIPSRCSRRRSIIERRFVFIRIQLHDRWKQNDMRAYSILCKPITCGTSD